MLSGACGKSSSYRNPTAYNVLNTPVVVRSYHIEQKWGDYEQRRDNPPTRSRQECSSFLEVVGPPGAHDHVVCLGDDRAGTGFRVPGMAGVCVRGVYVC